MSKLKHELYLERAGRQGRNAVLTLAGGEAKVFVKARDKKWYEQQRPQVSADGVALAAAVLGKTGYGLYRVVAVKTMVPGTLPVVGLDELPEGDRSNEVRFVVRRKGDDCMMEGAIEV